MRLSVLLLLALCVACSAQPPAKQPAPSTKPEDLASISGQVLNAVTGEPLRRASVTLMRADPTPGDLGPPLSYSTSSDAAGQFTMKDVEPGKYRMRRNATVSLRWPMAREAPCGRARPSPSPGRST